MHVGGLTWVPRYSPTMDSPSMWSGTCDVPKCPDVKQSAQLHILPRCQSGQVEV